MQLRHLILVATALAALFIVITPFEVKGVSEPKNESLDLINPAFGDNGVYARKEAYIFRVRVSDADGRSDIESVELILAPGTLDITFRWLRDGDKFEEVNDPNGFAEISTSESKSINNTSLRKSIYFAILFEWSYPTEADQNVKVVSTDSFTVADEDIYYNIYRVENDLAIYDLKVSDTRVSPSETVTFSGRLYYEATEVLPPDGNYNVEVILGSEVKGKDTSLSNGEFSVGIKLESKVDVYSYKVKADYAALMGTFPQIIVDRIKVTDFEYNDSRTNVGSTQLLWWRLEYEFDRRPFDDKTGALSVGAFDAVWNRSYGRWEARVSSNAVGLVTYELTVTDYKYGLKDVSGNSSLSIIWDRIVVRSMNASAERVNVGTNVYLWAIAELEYDGQRLGSRDRLVVNGVEMNWDPYLNKWAALDSRSQVEEVVYDQVAAYEDRYEITAVAIQGVPLKVHWDKINFAKIGTISPRANPGVSITLWAELRYASDGLLFDDTMGTVTIDGVLATYNRAMNRWERTVTSLGMVGAATYRVAFTDTVFEITGSNGSSQITVITDRIRIFEGGVDDSRVDVLSRAVVWYRAQYEYDKVVFDSDKGVLLVNDLPAYWNSEKSRWEYLAKESSVGLRIYRVTSVNDKLYGLTAMISSVNPQSVIWDRIRVVEGGASAVRVDVGSSSTVYFVLHYEFDNTPIADAVVEINWLKARFNSALERWELQTSEESVKRVNFKVTYAIDNLYNITTLRDDSGRVEVAWDRLKIDRSGSSDPEGRVDISSRVSVFFSIRYESDNTPMSKGTVRINGSLAKYNQKSLVWEIEVFEESVAKKSFVVTSVSDGLYGLTNVNDVAGSASVIWDRLEVYEAGAESKRVDYNAPGVFWFKIRYAYDKEEFTTGEVELNASAVATWSPTSQRWEYSEVLGSIGRLTYNVEMVKDEQYGLTSTNVVNLAGSASIIWDRVSITLKANRERYDAGFEADISSRGEYEFDGEPFIGSISLNDSLKKTLPGIYHYSVKSIRDDVYGLNAYTSNTIALRFDQVEIVLSTDGLSPVGGNASITWIGRYSLEKKPFLGTVMLNDSTSKTKIGTYSYTVESISDPIYGLKSFRSNIVTVTFGQVTITGNFETLIPGRLKADLRLSLEPVKSPVEDALVTVNGVKAIEKGKGLYEAELQTWLPVKTVIVEAEWRGSGPTIIEETIYPLGNIFLITIMIVIVSAVAAAVIRRRRSQLY